MPCPEMLHPTMLRLAKQCAYSRDLPNAPIELTICSRPEITLTDHDYSVVRRRVAEFKSANAEARSKIVKECADKIKSFWLQDAPFNRKGVETVSGPPFLPFVPFSQLLSWFADTYSATPKPDSPDSAYGPNGRILTLCRTCTARKSTSWLWRCRRASPELHHT